MNIFVTVGAQMPFDRLIQAVDEFAGSQTSIRFFAQIGESTYKPRHLDYAMLLEPVSFRKRVEWADGLVAHAGMGSILTALQFGKPILVMPRRGDLKETRNDHQVATAERFRQMANVAVAMDESELASAITRLQGMGAGQAISDRASEALISGIREFIHDDR
jgi:UDP-N-acetylglucosamine transferase subunit ALG13